MAQLSTLPDARLLDIIGQWVEQCPTGSQEDKTDTLKEVARRFEEKNASIVEMEFMTKKLLELNEKTKHAEAIKSQFLSLIKNEFNNPISSLLNLSHSVVTGKHLDKIRSISEMMEMELLRLDFQLKNIFAATEIEAGETANHFSLVNFRTVFDDAMASFPYLVEEKKLQVTLESLSDLSQPPLQCL